MRGPTCHALLKPGWIQKGGCGGPFREAPGSFRIWHHPRIQGRRASVMIVIPAISFVFQGQSPQVTGCETLSIKLGSRDQLKWLSLSSFPATHNLPAWAPFLNWQWNSPDLWSWRLSSGWESSFKGPWLEEDYLEFFSARHSYGTETAWIVLLEELLLWAER